jgi:hypothetical protein
MISDDYFNKADQAITELTCIMEHINVRKASKDRYENEREIDVGAAKAHCLPLGKEGSFLMKIDSLIRFSGLD